MRRIELGPAHFLYPFDTVEYTKKIAQEAQNVLIHPQAAPTARRFIFTTFRFEIIGWQTIPLAVK